MQQRRRSVSLGGSNGGGGGGGGGRFGVGEVGRRKPSLLTRAVGAVFDFFRLAEFEILFVLFFFVAFLIFKDLTSRPEYNDILVRKPRGDSWPFWGKE